MHFSSLASASWRDLLRKDLKRISSSDMKFKTWSVRKFWNIVGVLTIYILDIVQDNQDVNSWITMINVENIRNKN